MPESNHSQLESIPNVLLTELPLRPSSLQWWHQKGLRSTMEVQQGFQKYADGSMIQWSQDLGAKSVGFLARLYQEVQSCLETYRDTRTRSNTLRDAIFVRGHSAAELLQQFQADSMVEKSAILTFCRRIDAMLGGGVPLGELTEICGEPGIGKTQWSMQLTLNVQVPEMFGGVGGSAIYIDTEGSLTPERCHDMACCLWNHVVRKHQSQPDCGPLPSWFTIEGLLAGIQVVRVYDVASLDATISTLETLCQNAQRPVRLVVIDSLAFPVRAESTSDFIGRTQQLSRWAIKLSQFAQNYPPRAVIALNQMTTTAASTHGANSVNPQSSLAVGSALVPALGEAWAHAVTNRLVLSQGAGDTRICRLVKSPRLAAGQAEYTIAEEGVRDARHSHRSKRLRTSENS